MKSVEKANQFGFRLVTLAFGAVVLNEMMVAGVLREGTHETLGAVYGAIALFAVADVFRWLLSNRIGDELLTLGDSKKVAIRWVFIVALPAAAAGYALKSGYPDYLGLYAAVGMVAATPLLTSVPPVSIAIDRLEKRMEASA